MVTPCKVVAPDGRDMVRVSSEAVLGRHRELPSRRALDFPPQICNSVFYRILLAMLTLCLS
jgi:hypothetical protein